MNKPGGGAWTVTDVNNLQVRVTSPDINTGRITTLYVYVTYQPATFHRQSGAVKMLHLDIM